MGLNKAHLRAIVDYVHATENEISVDRAAYHSCGISPGGAGYLPRPSKWFHKLNGRMPLVAMGGRLLACIWPWGGAAVFNAFEFLRFFFQLRYKGDPYEREVSQETYGLGFSSRAADIIRQDSFTDAPACWITLPWVPLTLPDDCRRIAVFALLRPRDLLAAYLMAQRAAWVLSKHRKVSSWVLQSYTAFRWFTVRIALNRLHGTFWTAEHFDRWAVLADSVVSQRKFDNRTEGSVGARLFLVQHGIVGIPSPAGCGFPYDLTYRLKAVDRLYVYDDISSAIFTESILAPNAVASVDVRLFTPRLVRSERKAAGKFGILFVGHPLCERLHLFLHDQLRHYADIHEFYKPHPTSSASSQVRVESWEFIVDKNAYPDVDLLIAYPSTLVTEYALLGVDALVHPLNLEVEHAEDFLRSVKARLHSGTTILC